MDTVTIILRSILKHQFLQYLGSLMLSIPDILAGQAEGGGAMAGGCVADEK